MRRSALFGVLVGGTFATIAVACGSSSTGDGTAASGQDAAAEGSSTNPAGCPAVAPSPDTACGVASVSCQYGAPCGTYASCVNGKWQVASAGCQGPENACVSMGGSCAYSQCGAGLTQAPGDSFSTPLCGTTSGPGAVRVCCIAAPDAGPDASDAGDGGG